MKLELSFSQLQLYISTEQTFTSGLQPEPVQTVSKRKHPTDRFDLRDLILMFQEGLIQGPYSERSNERPRGPTCKLSDLASSPLSDVDDKQCAG